MKLQTKIVLISFGITLLLGVLAGTLNYSGRPSELFMIMGMVGFFAGIVQFIAGLFLLIKTDKRYAQGFLISGGILILVGFTTCTANLTMNMH